MKKRAFIAIAAIGGLLAAGACTKKDEAPADTAGASAMTDTGTGAAGSYTTPPAPTMSDTAAAATGTDTVKGRSSGDTTTKK